MNHDDDVEHIYLDDEDQNPPKQQAHHPTSAVENPQEYKKFRNVLIGILIVSTSLTVIRGIELERFIADFMAVFLITFAAGKFIDIEGFAHAYREYDVLGQRIRPWAYVVPYIEALLGFWYLLSEGPINLNVVTMALMGVAYVGARQKIHHKSHMPGTLAGKYIRVPLIYGTYIENIIMFSLATVMLVLKVIL